MMNIFRFSYFSKTNKPLNYTIQKKKLLNCMNLENGSDVMTENCNKVKITIFTGVVCIKVLSDYAFS